MPRRLTIVVSGMIAGDPGQGGAAWAVLQYLLGFERLGHEVWFIEPINREALNPPGAALAESTSAKYFHSVVRQFGFEETSALLVAGTRETLGASYQELIQATARADLLVNISGMLADEQVTQAIAVRLYLDLDPAFIQLWHAQGIDMRFAGHTHHMTVGQAIGTPACTIPSCGIDWLKTLPPIVLTHWPIASRLTYDGLTTIGNWRGYGSVEHRGVHYGQKAHSVRQFIDLPRLGPCSFMPALAIHAGETGDLAALGEHGWQLLDPAVVAGTPDAYRSFIQESKAELGIAKSGYAVSRCGWFSDRSAAYLASGRPVIGQDTGFADFLPTGAGLFSFRTTEDVLAAIENMQADYDRHRKAARSIAEAYFDSDRVLPRLLSAVGL